jgi:AcrR family transcriptional regulator
VTTTEIPKRKRGRPRDPSVDERVLQATREVVAEVGVCGASMSAIADRAGVGKPTIYLRWPNLPEVIQAATDDVLDSPIIRERMREALRAVEALAATPNGRFIAEALVSPVGRRTVVR